jgi:hypothetical protein
MGAFSAIAVEVLAVIPVFPDRIIKKLFRLCYLHADLGQKGELEGRSVFVDQLLDIEPIEKKIIVFIHVKAFLGKVKCLVDEVSISIVHVSRVAAG